MHFPNFLKPVDHGERMTTQLADAKSGRLPSRILTHQLLPNIISLLGRSIMNGWPSIHNRLFQYIRDVYINLLNQFKIIYEKLHILTKGHFSLQNGFPFAIGAKIF